MVKAKNKILLGLLTLIFMVAVMLAPTLGRAQGMQIFVEVPQGDGVAYKTLEVEPTDRIEDVLDKLADQLDGVDMSTVHLIFAGRCISEETGNTLQDWSVQKDSTLTVVFSTGESGCHSTANCNGVYVDDKCCACGEDISVVFVPPASPTNNSHWSIVIIVSAFVLACAIAFIVMAIAKKRA